MNGFHYFMPADTYFGRDCIEKNREVFKRFGKKAMLVTGRTSAKKNGAQDDVIKALESVGIAWVLFDEIGENPDVETIERAGKMAVAEKVDFVIGIGGGSPMDASKAISVLAANPNASTEILFVEEKAAHLPVVAIPTTAGTGSEVTQFAILTLHESRTKSAIMPKIFAEVSFLDAKYMDTLSASVTNNTAVDALSHLIESYLSGQSNFMSEKIVEIGLSLFKDCIPALKARVYDAETRDKLMLASYYGGIAIAQTSTSIPHCLGYFLTYEKGIAHGRANGMVMQSYLELFPQGDAKVLRMLDYLGMKTAEEMGAFLNDVLDCNETFTEEEIQYYTDRAFEMRQKMESFPAYAVTKENILDVYKKSLMD